MKYLRFMLSVLLAFILTMGADMLLHGVLLQEIYNATPELWRSIEDMQDKALFLHGSKVLNILVAIACYEWISKHAKISAIGFGEMVGLIVATLQLGSYAYMPISKTLTIAWVIGAFLNGALIGLSIFAVSKIFK